MGFEAVNFVLVFCLSVREDREGDGVVLDDVGLVSQDRIVALKFLPHFVD